MPPPSALRLDEVRQWLFEAALPFWARAGVDCENGGFVEHLDIAGADGEASFKRVRAQARQIYVFAHAALLGWAPGRAIAEHGWRFLDSHGRRSDGAWVRRLDRRGEVLDHTSDAYDIAFVLFAHAWLYRLTGDQSFISSALMTVDALDRTLTHPSGMGWHSFEGCIGPLEQNPQMHLMEAAVELAYTTGEARFYDLVISIFDLFRQYLFDTRRGIVREYFTDDWARPDSAYGHVIEPGHMLEWSWILRRAERLLGLQVGNLPDTLYQRALALGRRPDGLIVDRVDPNGVVLLASCRLWPQTEALKAHIAAVEAGDASARPYVVESLNALLDRYLGCKPYGCWIDQLDQDLKPASERIPSTTFYHLFLAFSELQRARPLLQAAPND